MEPFCLDLTLEVTEGSTHDSGKVMVWCRLRADTGNPLELPPEFIVLERTSKQWSPPISREPEISPEELEIFVTLLLRRGFPDHPLEITVTPTDLPGWQDLRFRVRLNQREMGLDLTLQYGGIQGPDAPSLREILTKLALLAKLDFPSRWIDGTTG